VAAFDDTDVARIMDDGGVVRTRKKIVATIENARALLAIEREHGQMRDYLRSFDGYAALSADLRRRFTFLGELSAYYFLFRVGEPVPRFEEWEKTVPGDHPRMREMVELARSRGVSPETH
jgi:3-methyladenine DNA glycosylase Tag